MSRCRCIRAVCNVRVCVQRLSSLTMQLVAPPFLYAMGDGTCRAQRACTALAGLACVGMPVPMPVPIGRGAHTACPCRAPAASHGLYDTSAAVRCWLHVIPLGDGRQITDSVFLR